MPKVTQTPAGTPSLVWEELESFTRVHVQAFIQRLLEEEIDLAKERNLQMDEASMLGLQQSLASAKGRQASHKKSAEDLAKRKKPIPNDLKKDLKDSEAEIAKIEGQIAERRKVMEATRQRFDNDKQRFRELTMKDPASQTPQPLKVAPVQSPPATR